MSSSPASPSTRRRSSIQSDRPENLQYPLSDSDSSLIEHPSITTMDYDTNSEDGLGYLSDSTYEIISQSSFQASDSENEDDIPATPNDTDDNESIDVFGAATPSETSAVDEPDAISPPPAHREESFEEQRLRAQAEAEQDQAIIYTPEELEIDEKLSTPSLNTSTIRDSTVTTTGASRSIEEWITFKEPITSVADGLLNVTNQKQDVASSKLESSTARIAHNVDEALHNAIEACINLFDMVSRYAQAHLIEPSYQRLSSRDALATILPEDPRVTMPSLWAIAASLATPLLITCIVNIAQSSRSVSRTKATLACLNNRTCDPFFAAEALLNDRTSPHAYLDMTEDMLAFQSKALARSETGLSVFEPTTKPRSGWFGKARAKPETRREPEWKILSSEQTRRTIVFQHHQPLVDQFQFNVSSSQLSRTILFNPHDNALHYPENEAATMRSKISRVNQKTIELQLPSFWPCGEFNVSINPYPRKSLCITAYVFMSVIDGCKPAPSWKDLNLTKWLAAPFAEGWRSGGFPGLPTRLWEEFQPHLTHQGLNLWPTESAANTGPSTVDGRCGAAHGGSVCGNWSGGSCCSKNGRCGNTSSHCGAGCQLDCKNSLIPLPSFPKLPRMPQLDTKKLPTPRKISQILKDDFRQTREELRARADLFWEKLKQMNLRMTEYSAKSREERQLRREMQRAKALHRKLHKASEPGLSSLPVKKARTRALKLRDRADDALKRLQFQFQQWEANIGRGYLA